MTVQTCAECGFDATRWSPTDLRRTIAHADDLIGHATSGAGAAALGRIARLGPLRPVDDRGDAPVDAVPITPSDDVATTLEIEATHSIMHRLHEVAAIRRTVEPAEPLAGVVRGLHRSGGGVPKLAVEEVSVDAGGVLGDSQSARQHHGRPWQALCLYSSDVVDALRQEGHPIGPGSVGENVLIEGVDWSLLRGGLTITVGDVVCRTSVPADPCTKIGAAFADGDHRRVDHGRHPGWSRWYASVLAGGAIRLGDRVTVHS